MLQLSLSCWIGFGKHKLEVSLPPRPWGGLHSVVLKQATPVALHLTPVCFLLQGWGSSVLLGWELQRCMLSAAILSENEP